MFGPGRLYGLCCPLRHRLRNVFPRLLSVSNSTPLAQGDVEPAIWSLVRDQPIDVDELVPFVCTPTRFGGRRQRLRCLKCGRGCRKESMAGVGSAAASAMAWSPQRGSISARSIVQTGSGPRLTANRYQAQSAEPTAFRHLGDAAPPMLTRTDVRGA